MPETITISLDAMGGDTGPEVAIGGAAIAIDRRPDLRFLVFGEEASGASGSGSQSARARQIRVPSLRRDRADGRQAEPGAPQGALEVVDVALDPGGEGQRGGRRRLGRQYRRADGDGEVLPEAAAGNRAAGDRRDLADAARREHRARRRRDDRRRCPDARRFRGHGRGDGALRLRARPPDRRRC